jgi:hypothetical protein
MGQVMNAGGLILISALSLACSRERVDLGGLGAGGSTPMTEAGSAGAPWVPPRVPRPATTLTAPNVILSSPRTVPAMRSSLLELPVRDGHLPPISGGTLAVAADGSKAVAADPERDVVYLIDIFGERVQTLPLPPESEPGRVLLDDRGQAHVVLRQSGGLARIELATGTMQLSEPVCHYPRGIAYRADTQRLHVACADGQLVQLSAADHAPLEREQLASDLRDLAFDQQGNRIVSRFRSAGLLWQGAYAKHGELRPDALPWPSVRILPDGSYERAEVMTSASFGFRLVQAANNTVWLLHERAQVDALRAQDDYTGTRTGCGPVVQPALTAFSTSATPPQAIDSLQLNGIPAPAVDLAFSHDGTWVAIATPAGYAYSRPSVWLQPLEPLSAKARIQPRHTNGEFQNSPSEICGPVGMLPLALSSQAVAVAFDGNRKLYVQNRYPARLDVIQPILASSGMTWASQELSLGLSDDDVRELGHDWFHAELRASQLSCAACHAEGLDDAHVWTTSGHGPRRTPSLRGGISHTAPFGWTGDFAGLDNAIVEFTKERLGVNDLPPEVIAAVGGWLDKLPALSVPAQDAAAAVSGKELFESELGCAACHSGAQLTNNQTMDVGSGGAYQVPSLLGLPLRAPYMHDGCAADLEALFADAACARSGHAQLGSLDGERRSQLLAYLRSL